MKIAFVATYDPLDLRNWSGISHFMVNALKAQSLAVECIGPLRGKRYFFNRAKARLYKTLFSKNYLADRDPEVLNHYALELSRALSGREFDVVFSPSTIPIAYLECREPVVFWTDATFAGMVNFYPEFSFLSHESILQGNRMEAEALKRSRLAIYSSDWAVKSAIDNYGVSPPKVKMVPFGANFNFRLTLDEVKRVINNRPSGKCRLLFVGKDWKRKGGSIALEVVDSLNKNGLETELTILGCNPALPRSAAKFVKCAGFIDKSAKEAQALMGKFLAEAHFLILPTRAECASLSLCEANSFGVPCLATDLGGIPTIIKPNINGMLFKKDAAISEYCRYILGFFDDYAQYEQLALSSFERYDSFLNWQTSAREVKKLLLEIAN